MCTNAVGGLEKLRHKPCEAASRAFRSLAFATTLPPSTVFRLALRQNEGLIGYILALDGLDLAMPDYPTPSRSYAGNWVT